MTKGRSVTVIDRDEKGNTGMSIAVLSTLISSIALVGVAISLLFQARQLRANQIQVSRASLIELMKFYFDNPDMVAELVGAKDNKEFTKDVLTNWYVTHLSLSYENRAISKSHLQNLADNLFKGEAACRWWASMGHTYNDGATSRREKEFFAVLDGEFQRINHERESAQTDAEPPDTSSNISQ